LITHSFIRLTNGKFLVLSTVALTKNAKTEIDLLTANGSLIEAVLATHPFHTLHFEPFHKHYPNVKYYGTPRHIREIKTIQWEGDMSDPDVLSKWESQGVFMRIPEGAEFINPDDFNHFSSVFIYHVESRTLYDDDTIMCFENPGCLLKTFGIHSGQVAFHPVPWEDNLFPDSDAPIQFRDFMLKLLDDWDFDNIVTAHTGNKIGGARQALRDAFDKEIPALELLASSSEKVSCRHVL
jgi:hypothetical protein